jgi:hypothetical protein
MRRGSVSSVADGCRLKERLSPRSSVDQNEYENPSEIPSVSCPGGHVVDTANPLSGVNCHQSADTDSELATLIAVWTKLPEPIRAGIIAMVKAVT